MEITRDQMADIVMATLDWQISAAMGARDVMKPDCPSWRFADAYVRHLVHYYNCLLKYKGGVFSPDFCIPDMVL